HISASLQNQAMLVILDTYWINLIKSCGGCSGDVYNLHLIHEELCDCHTIDSNALRTFVNQYKKNLGIFKSNFSWAIFARVWLKDLSRSVDNSTNKLQQRFKKKIEKYNPKQEFLSISSFRKFENAFSLQRKEDGWNQSGIKHVVQGYNEIRSEFLVRLIKETKLLNIAGELVRESQLLFESENFNSNEINEEAWVKYCEQKLKVSLLKQEIYKFSWFLWHKIKN
ncbi:uncharacterized protein TNIN_154241, partial [Trichonephila inaurata madagascariensis]